MILLSLGYQLAGTPGTAAYYNKAMKSLLNKDMNEEMSDNVVMKSLIKPEDDKSKGKEKSFYHYTSRIFMSRLLLASLDEDDAVSWIRQKKIDLLINIPEGTTRKDEVTAGYLMRRAAVDFGASLLTNIK